MAQLEAQREGGSCRNCGKSIGSYQMDPGQMTVNGKQFCTPECRREFDWGHGIRR